MDERELLRSLGIKKAHDYNKKIERLREEMIARDAQMQKSIIELVQRELLTDLKAKLKADNPDMTDDDLESKAMESLRIIGQHINEKLMHHIIFTAQAKSAATRDALALNFLMKFKATGVSRQIATRILSKMGYKEKEISQMMSEFSRGRGIFNKKVQSYADGSFSIGHNDPMTLMLKAAEGCIECKREDAVKLVSTIREQLGDKGEEMLQKVLPSAFAMLGKLTSNPSKLAVMAEEFRKITGVYVDGVNLAADGTGVQAQNNVTPDAVTQIFQNLMTNMDTLHQKVMQIIEVHMQTPIQAEDPQKEEKLLSTRNALEEEVPAAAPAL